MGQPLFDGRNYVGRDAYVRALRNVYRSGLEVYEIDRATSKDPDILEKVLADPHLRYCIDQRVSRVIGSNWKVVSHDKSKEGRRAATVMNALIQEIPDFTHILLHHGRTFLTGRSYSLMYSDYITGKMGGPKEMQWWVPTQIQPIDYRRVRFIKGKDGIKMQLASVAHDKYEDVANPEWLVKYVYMDEESRLGYGRGILEPLYLHFWMKSKIRQEGLAGLERWAQGMLIAKINGDRAGSTDRTNDAIQDEFIAQLAEMRANNMLVIDREDSVEVMEQTGNGHQQVMEWLKMMDHAASELILGLHGGEPSHTATTDSATMAGSLVDMDRRCLEDALTRDLLGAIWRYNQANFIEIGAYSEKMPRFSIQRDAHPDIEKNVNVMSKVVAMGQPIVASEFYERLGLSEPTEDDKTIDVEARYMRQENFNRAQAEVAKDAMTKRGEAKGGAQSGGKAGIDGGPNAPGSDDNLGVGGTQ